MGRTACTEPQCLYKGALYLFTFTCLSPPPRKLSHVFRLYFSFVLVCITGADGQDVRNVTGGVDGRLGPITIGVHSFPDPTVVPQAIQWRILCGDSDVPSTVQ